MEVKEYTDGRWSPPEVNKEFYHYTTVRDWVRYYIVKWKMLLFSFTIIMIITNEPYKKGILS